VGGGTGRLIGAATGELHFGVPASTRDCAIAAIEGERDMRRSAVIGAVFVAVVLAGCSDSTGTNRGSAELSPTSTIAAVAAESTTVPTTVPPIVGDDSDPKDAATAAVLSALEAKNSFDLDGWLAAFEGGQRVGIPRFAEEILMNAEERWEVVEPCQVTGETTSGDTVVECLNQETTSYWGVGGISGTKVQTFTVNTDGLITNNNHFGSARKNTFNALFHQWLSDTYPDVYNEMGYGHISSTDRVLTPGIPTTCSPLSTTSKSSSPNPIPTL
jgi:hypothetical protein